MINSFVNIVPQLRTAIERLNGRGVRKWVLVAGCWLLVFSSDLFAQSPYTSIANGNWNSDATWSGIGIPGAADIAIINGHNVTITANASINQLTIQSNGSLTFSNANSYYLYVNNVGGFIQVNTGCTINGGTNNSIIQFSTANNQQLIVNGIITSLYRMYFTNTGRTVTISGAGDITTRNDFRFETNNGIDVVNNLTGIISIGRRLNFNTSNCELINNGNIVVTEELRANTTSTDNGNIVTNNSGGSISINGDFNPNSCTLIINNFGTFDLNGNISNIQAGEVQVYDYAGSVFRWAGLTYDIDLQLYCNYNSNDFIYDRGGDQSIILPSDVSYWNLITDNSGIKTLTGNTSVNGDLTINSGTSLQLGIRNFTVNGSTNISGTILDNSATGIDRFVGLVTTNAGANWDFNAGDGDCEFRGGLNHNGAGFNSGTGTYSFTTNSQPLGGTTNIRFDGPVTVTGGGVILNNAKTTTIAGILGGTGTWNNNSGSTLYYENTTAPTVTGFTVNANPNTVNYSQSGNQTIRATTYHNLILSNSGNKSFRGTLTINGNLNIENSAVLQNSGSNDIYLAGNWTDNNTADGFTEGTGEVFFNGTTQQTITKAGGTGAESFYDLTLNNSNGLNLASGDLNITHQFSFTTGNITFANSSDMVYLSAGTPASLIYTSVTGSRIIGKFERRINTTGTYLFPVGTATNYNPANLIINAAPVAGSVLTEFISGAPGNSGLPINEGGVEVSDAFTDGYWSFTAKNGFSSGNYSVNLNGTGFSTSIYDITRVIKRTCRRKLGI